MINEIKGDLLTAKGIILHGVNCQGVMGSGVALAIKNKWPEVFEAYQYYVRNQGGSAYANHYIGTVQFVGTKDEDVMVANCFTQDRYGNDGEKYASYDAIDLAMQRTAELATMWNLGHTGTINFPLIGCGLGGLYWPVVREIIDHRIPDTFTKNLYRL